MKTNLEKDALKIEEAIVSIGSDLAAAGSLVKYLDLSLNEEFDISNMDVANLTIVLREHLKQIMQKYDKLECILEL